MDSATMLSELRGLLDESTAGFWEDTDCYASLTDGQLAYINIIFSAYTSASIRNPKEPLPQILRTIYTEATGTLNHGDVAIAALPAGFLNDVSLYLTGSYNRPFYRRDLSRERGFAQVDVYSDPYNYTVLTTSIALGTSIASTSGYTLGYLKSPDDISASKQPTLPVETHQAIVVFAFAQLLKKAKLFESAKEQFQEFLSRIKYF